MLLFLQLACSMQFNCSMIASLISIPVFLFACTLTEGFWYYMLKHFLASEFVDSHHDRIFSVSKS